MKQLVFLAVILPVIWLSSDAWSIDAVAFDSDAELKRYQQLTYELRCPKCQNQNLIDSDSQISQDLRREVARLIRDGKSDQEIKQHMVSMYGDFILYRPPVQPNTVVLWMGPVVMVGIGLLVFGVILLKRMRLDSDNEETEDAALEADDTSMATQDSDAHAVADENPTDKSS